MSADVNLIVQRGGRPLIDLLTYCVCSVNVDALFVFLVGEYRMLPSTDKALALYDLFCALAAPARIHLDTHSPPKNARLTQDLAPYVNARKTIEQLANATPEERSEEASEKASEDVMPTNLMLHTPIYLFDNLSNALRSDDDNPLTALNRTYDPERTPYENLPGGTMTAVQKHFVDYVWAPHVRPRLAGAGFLRIANVG